jgi:tetratricopeptide (TPR) repeat protein
MKNLAIQPFKLKPARRLFFSMLLFWISGQLCSCQKYLDAKPDKSLAVPTTLQDFRALMDFQGLTNNFPYAGSIASDDYFVGLSDWQAFEVNPRNTYIWDAQAASDMDWSYAYGNIMRTNVVLGGIDAARGPKDARDNIKGQALFFRGYLFYQLANIYTLPYQAGSAGTDLGIPLKLKADITAKTTRSTLATTYSQIIADLKSAAALLPISVPVKTRPSRPAAYGALARTYLAMGEYASANRYADSCLRDYSKLIDYNTLDTSSVNPFPMFNDEVVFHATDNAGGDVVDPYYARVDTALFATYAPNDLRRYLFYTYAENGHYAFKGDYLGASYGALFNGIATDEQLLIRSETYARLGQISKAIGDLNALLVTRYKSGSYAPYPANMTADAALALILAERRKELAFRSEIRWGDLRRLSGDARFARTLKRVLGPNTYMLAPGDKRYAFLLPVSVVLQTGIPQNAR